MKQLMLLSIFLLLLVASGAKDFIKAGDRKLKLHDYDKALLDYTEAEKLDPENEEVLWKIGFVYNRLALDSKGETRHKYFTEASSYLSRSLAQNPKIAEAHIELARMLIFMELLNDNWDSYKLARRAKEELDYAKKLNPKLPDTYFLLGLWHKQICKKSLLWRKPLGLGDASKELALKNLEKAIDIEPKKIEYLLELAKLQIDMGYKAEGIKQLKKIKKLTPLNNYEKELKDEAATLYAVFTE